MSGAIELSFLTPPGGFVALAVVLPLVGALVAERRSKAARRTLGLSAPPLRSHVALAFTALSFFALVGLAATQPVLRLERPVSARPDAEAFFLFDISRSMLAARAADAPSRFARAVDLAVRLRASLPDVPVGVASLTDRSLPHLFPTVDQEAHALVVRRALGIERPPPRDRSVHATDFRSIEALADENYFGPQSVHRLVVLWTDGESRPFDAAALVRKLERHGVALVVVRVWHPDERVFGKDGRPEPAYRPDPESLVELARLARAGGSVRVFSENDVDAAARAGRRFLGRGPLVEAGTAEPRVPLAPYVALAAALPLAAQLARAGVGRRARRFR